MKQEATTAVRRIRAKDARARDGRANDRMINYHLVEEAILDHCEKRGLPFVRTFQNTKEFA